jgi:hypothetical protein
LADIFGGPALTVECHLAKHGLQFKLNGLIDSGAGGEAFIHPRLLPAIRKYFQVQVLQIKHGGVSISGFDNKHAGTINKVFNLDLLIAGRRVLTWFLVCDTGRHDMFIGRIWLARNRALIDCEDRTIRWKDKYPPQITSIPAGLTVPTSEIVRKCQKPHVDKQHQQDADRRDTLMERQIRNGQIKVLRRSQSQSESPALKGGRSPQPALSIPSLPP